MVSRSLWRSLSMPGSLWPSFCALSGTFWTCVLTRFPKISGKNPVKNLRKILGWCLALSGLLRFSLACFRLSSSSVCPFVNKISLFGLEKKSIDGAVIGFYLQLAIARQWTPPFMGIMSCNGGDKVSKENSLVILPCQSNLQ